MRLTRLIGLLLAAAGLAGCGGGDLPKTYPVSGKVVFAGGKPLAGGAVQLRLNSDPSKAASGEIKADGTFSLHTIVGNKKLAGAVEGEHDVSVIPLMGEDQKLIEVRVKQSPIRIEPKENSITIVIEKLP